MVNTVDEYISARPEPIRLILEEVRTLIRKIAPEARETISYGMPAYKINGKPLVYFAAQTKHLGFYATPSGHAKFAEKLSAYKQGKGSVQFPFDKPVPFDLIAEMVQFRLEEENDD